MDYWRDIVQEFQATGDFNGDFIDKGLIQFCFLKIIQNKLDTVVRIWDNHRIRPDGNGCALYHGKPCLMSGNLFDNIDLSSVKAFNVELQ
ncbi:hypothetical protein AAFF_G00198270 [Aldrovandia affinis]|uniref:Uncharacterized protein n=1 Tax=Aldrovandia affinis TaxID=143900 RepID=A0AAD7W639_9TELE|nr:hypothetical protein AAFF_G00198270 [Aldrovandia affinis]